MITIVPALLPKTFAELAEGLELLHGISRQVQVDLVGRNVLAGHDEMPRWQEYEFEVDMMLPEPHQELDAVLALGPTRMVIHAANQHARAALDALQGLRDGNYPVAVGVALLPTASPEALEEFAGLYDFVQVMGIDQVGAQGRPFNPRAIELVSRIRAIYATLPIQVDGAAATHPQELAAAGADRLIVGQAIVGAKDPALAYKEIYNKANGIVKSS